MKRPCVEGVALTFDHDLLLITGANSRVDRRRSGVIDGHE